MTIAVRRRVHRRIVLHIAFSDSASTFDVASSRIRMAGSNRTHGQSKGVTFSAREP